MRYLFLLFLFGCVNPLGPTATFLAKSALQTDDPSYMLNVPTVLRAQMYSEIGMATIRTNKATVALNFSDGVWADPRKVLPHLVKRGLTASFALNSGKLIPGRMLWSDVRKLQDAGMEVINHTNFHKLDSVTFYDDVIQPLVTFYDSGYVVRGFLEPGKDNDDFDIHTFDNLSIIWARIVLANHASVMFQIDENTRGIVRARHGVRIASLQQTYSGMKNQLDNLIANRGSAVIGVHAVQIFSNGTNIIDSLEFLHFLDDIVAYRDAGKLNVLTVSGLGLAQFGEPENLFPNDIDTVLAPGATVVDSLYSQGYGTLELQSDRDGLLVRSFISPRPFGISYVKIQNTDTVSVRVNNVKLFAR